LGDIEKVLELNNTYDVILANIQFSVLTKDLMHYTALLKENGYLVMSGFFFDDLYRLEDVAKKNGFRLIKSVQKDQWGAARFIKEK
jgi:ribosomal protein L11 methyltransferase